jgi:hypothetical protein
MMGLGLLLTEPAILITAICAAIALVIFIAIDAHRNKKKRHKGRWK